MDLTSPANRTSFGELKNVESKTPDFPIAIFIQENGLSFDAVWQLWLTNALHEETAALVQRRWAAEPSLSPRAPPPLPLGRSLSMGRVGRGVADPRPATRDPGRNAVYP